ncbi:uncharacterized protein PHALS_12062 [Plasmopara halstedii]|uniref:Helicase-associated domain-containing protein n=1 Tax=Plasmopara halstedii TaxID=4781 RepID=A0A0P1ALA9_PLAHL|nr:uncharacterized protein PHALS_12062 [Plasmopara halstedii]CEG41733.1 hypothetical protein PHALS_12062 [Plasmopara halstedii]|eukprot:XP_024578102.1 hypothetical protein PHALS_12062 [Plasmopara halstedii]
MNKRVVSDEKLPKKWIDEIQEFTKIGFPIKSWQEHQFQHVHLPAIKTYREHYGHLIVPQKFQVPFDGKEAERWPRATRGLKLGNAVSKLRIQGVKTIQLENDPTKPRRNISKTLPPIPKHWVEELEALGFVWRILDTKWYDMFLPGLRKYKELNGNLHVPQLFIIPKHKDDPRWSKELEGYRLGRHVQMIREGKYALQVQECQEELQALGFSYRVQEKVWWGWILPSLHVFKAEYRHCDVGQKFIIPSRDPWPREAWGFKLGQTIRNIRQGAYEVEVQSSLKELEELEFVWNARDRVEKMVRRIVVPALSTFRQLYGNHAVVGTDFIVPEGDLNWPEQTRGFRLGLWITRVRSQKIKLTPTLRKELDKVGFVWRSNDQRWNDILLPSFQAYAALHDGTCASMNTRFIVPPEPPYPQAAWGVNLGGALWHIRNGDSYVNCQEKAQILRQLGVLSNSTERSE